jgi:probable F420-dependent oxidoreductase
MHFGLCFFPTDDSMAPGELAAAAEERGFESVWFAEHSHIPVSEVTPGPPQPGEMGLPRPYYAVADPFVSLALAAAATKRLRLATGVCLVPQRDVFQMAKEVATLDFYSGGRVLFGVGGGWNAPEIQDHGCRFEDRFAVMRERVEAMKELWTKERAEYHGRFVDFGPCYAWPKPFRKPHPPIHVGGGGLPAIRRAVRYGDGWVPLAGGGPNDPIEWLPRLHEELAKAGRDPRSFEVSIYFCPAEAAYVDRCRERGITRALFAAPSADRDATLAVLDSYRSLLAS